MKSLKEGYHRLEIRTLSRANPNAQVAWIPTFPDAIDNSRMLDIIQPCDVDRAAENNPIDKIMKQDSHPKSSQGQMHIPFATVLPGQAAPGFIQVSIGESAGDTANGVPHGAVIVPVDLMVVAATIWHSH